MKNVPDGELLRFDGVFEKDNKYFVRAVDEVRGSSYIKEIHKRNFDMLRIELYVPVKGWRRK